MDHGLITAYKSVAHIMGPQYMFDGLMNHAAFQLGIQ